MNKYLKNTDRIEFVVTMKCTGRCKHCSEGDHISDSLHIDTDIAVDSIMKICRLYDIKSLMTFGGEPLLYPETVAAIQRTAFEMGIPKRDIITNGYFSKDKDRINNVVRLLSESNVNCVLLSVDAFHQETIPIEPVEFFAERLKEAGIPVKLSPAWLVSKEDSNTYNIRTKELIERFIKKGFAVGDGNIIFPQGNALKYLSEYFREGETVKNPYEESPYDIRSLCFGCDGSILNGNVYDTDIIKIIDEYVPG